MDRNYKKETVGLKEADEQVKLFNWIREAAEHIPELRFVYSTLNGVKLPIGLAVKAKKQGNLKGVPDIVWPYNNGEFSGLYIELKVGYNTPSQEQKEYIQFLKDNKYKAEVCYGHIDAINTFCNYIKVKNKQTFH